MTRPMMPIANHTMCTAVWSAKKQV